jgi:hypothetical protein
MILVTAFCYLLGISGLVPIWRKCQGGSESTIRSAAPRMSKAVSNPAGNCCKTSRALAII